MLAFQGLRAVKAGIFSSAVLWSIALIAILGDLMRKRRRFVAPGPEVRASQQPDLLALIGRVAGAAGTKMPRAVYMTGELNASVFQPRGLLGGSGGPAIALGFPLLQTLTVSELASVIAHELAHYRHGDTLLSAWTYCTRETLLRSAQRRRVSPLQLLIDWYRTAYLTLTAGMARQEEFAADALAAKVTGARAASNALTSPRKSAYLAYWEQELWPVQASGFMPRSCAGFDTFYAARPAEMWPEAAEQPDGDIDSSPDHPPLGARLRAIAALEPAEPLLPEDARCAIDLLRDPEETVYQLWLSAGGGALDPISWDETTHRIFIPRWRQAVAAHADSFAGIRAESFDSLSKERVISRVRSSYGMSSEEECRSAAERLGACALGLALLDSGWVPKGAPGSPYEFEKDGRRLRPVEEIHELWSGRITSGQWRERMSECKVGTVQLG